MATKGAIKTYPPTVETGPALQPGPPPELALALRNEASKLSEKLVALRAKRREEGVRLEIEVRKMRSGRDGMTDEDKTKLDLKTEEMLRRPNPLDQEIDKVNTQIKQLSAQVLAAETQR